MKKVIISTILLLILFINLSGQWYVKKYHVTDINFLTREQLEESLANSKTGLKTAGIIAGTGGVFFLGFKYLRPGMSDDPSIIEQILGDEGVNKVGMITGIGILIGGSIAGIVYLGRIGRIKSVINRNYPSVGSLDISPTIILNGYTRSSSPGFMLTYNF
jgi:hypothetical protein